MGLRYELNPPFFDTFGNLFSVYIPFLDATPNVADLSRYPKFIRQGKGSDPYAGIPIRWPDIGVVQDGRLGDRLVQTDYNDFAPRIGITYAPTSKWVVRTGAGMFYNQDTGNPRFDMARNIAGRIRVNSDLRTQLSSGAMHLQTLEEGRRRSSARMHSQTNTSGARRTRGSTAECAAGARARSCR